MWHTVIVIPTVSAGSESVVGIFFQKQAFALPTIINNSGSDFYDSFIVVLYRT